MKKSFFLLFIIASAVLGGKAQIKSSSVITGNRAVGLPAQKPIPATLGLAPGKDLEIVIDSVVDKSTATNSNVQVYYSLLNRGVADIDITNISVRSYLNGAPAPAVGIASALFSSTSPILHSGQKWNDRNYNSGLPFKVTVMSLADPAQPLFVNHTYNYSIKADADNIISETNENNNTANISIAGRYVPAEKDLAISSLNIQYDPANKRYNVSCRIGNVGTSNVDLNAIAYWDCVNGGGYTSYAGPIILGDVRQASCGASACGFSVRLSVTASSNIMGPGQVYTAQGFAYGYHGACGGPLTFTYVLDPDNKTGDQNLSNNTLTASITESHK